jgi:hypothetical protein
LSCSLDFLYASKPSSSLSPCSTSPNHHNADTAHDIVASVMSDNELGKQEEQIESDVRELKLEGVSDTEDTHDLKSHPSVVDASIPTMEFSSIKKTRSSTQSPVKLQSGSQTPVEKLESVGGDIIVKLEPGKAPKLARTSSQKVVARPPTLYTDEPDMYDEATSTFEVIQECNYATRWLGSTEQAMECDCREHWGK